MIPRIVFDLPFKNILKSRYGEAAKLFRLALARCSVRGPAFMGSPKPSLGALLAIVANGTLAWLGTKKRV